MAPHTSPEDDFDLIDLPGEIDDIGPLEILEFEESEDLILELFDPEEAEALGDAEEEEFERRYEEYLSTRDASTLDE